MPIPRFNRAHSLGPPSGGALVAIGNFDGVHRGHEHVLRAAAELARVRGLSPIVLTFYPHPATVLRGYRVPLLTDIDRRCDLIAAIDPELTVVVEPFTVQFAETRPDQFVRDLLVAQLGARVVSVGHNFRFGNRRRSRSGIPRLLFPPLPGRL